MKRKAKAKIPAKINLTLDVFGGENGYHNLKSLVASVNLFDAITLYRRKDDIVTLLEKGVKAGCQTEDNNAVKCYRYLMKEYNLPGANIVINKKIPVGAGLGGSSADVAGVILATEKLFKIKIDYKKTADLFGSDVMYMLIGGFAVISGRGNDVEKLPIKKTLYINLIDNLEMVSAKDSYNKFDELNIKTKNKTEKAVSALLNGEDFYKHISNDLQKGSTKILPRIEYSLGLIRLANAKNMTGSGSAVYGVYEYKEKRNLEYKILERKTIIHKLKTI